MGPAARCLVMPVADEVGLPVLGHRPGRARLLDATADGGQGLSTASPGSGTARSSVTTADTAAHVPDTLQAVADLHNLPILMP